MMAVDETDWRCAIRQRLGRVFNVVSTSDGLRRFGDRVRVPSPLFRTVAIGLGSEVV